MQSASANQSNDGSYKISSRIAPVDGLRACAVMGVVWAHVWLFCGNPVFSIGKIGSVTLDIHRVISIIGTGVDLFFVISGFCMYLMYARNQSTFSLKAYLTFLKNRWIRIAPAFYVSALACGFGIFLFGEPFPYLSLLSHAVFAHLWIQGLQGLSSPFWSLATEWHFYLLLPAMIWASSKWGIRAVLAASMVASMFFRFAIYVSPSDIVGFWKPQIPTRFVEFGWGILVAYLYKSKIEIPSILSKERGFLIGLIIAFVGRLLMTTEIIKLSGYFGFVCQVFAEPVLTLGYAIMLWNVIASNSMISFWLSCSSLQHIGRWSYSLYLWHWYPCLWISQQIIKYLGSSILSLNISFILSMILIIPISFISYRYLEQPYFKNRHSQNLS